MPSNYTPRAQRRASSPNKALAIGQSANPVVKLAVALATAAAQNAGVLPEATTFIAWAHGQRPHRVRPIFAALPTTVQLSVLGELQRAH